MIKLITHYEAIKAINLKLHLRRLELYSLAHLEDAYLYEKNKVLFLYREIQSLYDIKKLNFASEFNRGSRYLENCQDNHYPPKKNELITAIVLFLKTQYFIESYLNQLEEIQAKI